MHLDQFWPLPSSSSEPGSSLTSINITCSLRRCENFGVAFSAVASSTIKHDCDGRVSGESCGAFCAMNKDPLCAAPPYLLAASFVEGSICGVLATPYPQLHERGFCGAVSHDARHGGWCNQRREICPLHATSENDFACCRSARDHFPTVLPWHQGQSFCGSELN